MEVGDIGAQAQQLGLGLFVVLDIIAARVHAHVVEDRREQFIRRVHEGHAALAELLEVLRLEHHRPRVDVIDPQHLLDLVDVVADAIGAPQVGHRMLVAAVVLFQGLEQHRVEVFPVRQLLAVEFQERAGFDLAREKVVGRHDHVVTGATGQQLAFQGFVGVEHVIDDLDTGAALEIRQGGFTDIVGPVVHADTGLGLGCGADQQRQGRTCNCFQ
ncbi:hypothetical protein D3C81_1330780 [compost metagenome]